MGSLYLVTGAGGHLGNTVVRLLTQRGEEVRAFALPGERTDGVLPDGVEVVRGNLCDRESLRALFERAGGRRLVVIHCAGIVTIQSKFDQRVWDVNVGGTRNIVSLCEEYGAAKLVYVSSVHAISEPPDGGLIRETDRFTDVPLVGLYAQTKAAATASVLEAAKRGLDASVVHPSGIIGPYDYGHGHMTQLVLDYVQGRLTAAIRGGYDFTDVRDVAAGIIACCDKGRRGECYILSNRYVSVNEMLDTVHELTGTKKIAVYLPIWFVKLVAPVCETYYKLRHQTPLFTAYSIYTLGSDSNFSHEKADRELGYTTRPLRDSLSDEIGWLREQGRL
ncbi:MAG: NAD-dependent epimerase/dehydratase family protein [Oscillospiraceae bacterium]|nr:NAD-dependent epimerase/dehydratase family protein [Oscillospiraceae bacterium]